MDIATTTVTIGCEKEGRQYDRQALIREIGSEKLLKIYANMVRTRALDAKIDQLMEKYHIVQHPTTGQEATPVAACTALEKTDYIWPYHRGWAWAMGKGMKPGPMLAEMLGRTTGYNKGKSGVQIGDVETRVMGRLGMQGAHLTITAGVALSLKLRQTGEVVVAFFGDGASNTPSFFDALNLTSVWKAPAVFICENNGYAVTTKVSEVMNVEDVADRAVAFGIPGVVVDGNDAVLVYKVAGEAVERARLGDGPTLIEAKTYRTCGHAWIDANDGFYRSREEVEQWKLKDPIRKLEGDLLAAGWLTQGEVAAVAEAAKLEMDEAAEFAIASPLPTKEELIDVRHLYA